MNEPLPPGLYTSEDGTTKYWDGRQWLERVEGKKPAPSKKLVMYISIAIALLTILTFSVVFIQNEQKAAAARAQAALIAQTEKAFRSEAAFVKKFFGAAVSKCEILGRKGIVYDMERLTIDGRGQEDSSGAENYTVFCLLEETKMPAAVESRFRNTNSLQGLVEGQWDVLDGDAEIKAMWSYHPDSGVQIGLELSSVYLEKFNYEKHKDLVDITPSS